MSNKHQTLLGFDYGRMSIGVAVGQTVTKTAKPLLALKAENGLPAWEVVAELIQSWKPDCLVVGLPLGMDGKPQETTEKALQLAKELHSHFHLPVYTIDERLTTVEAKARLFEQGGYRALGKSAIDAVSAQIILESWMSQESDIQHASYF
ncbi:MAG: Holliday junction DNA helicase RuvA [Gammaproteobacteria bacterium GWF2_41_13]|nr:MAG: Holliday junction DNA helicase RuvA [Gammaproteobacteria bacterium GWF2_41_13]